MMHKIWIKNQEGKELQKGSQNNEKQLQQRNKASATCLKTVNIKRMILEDSCSSHWTNQVNKPQKNERKQRQQLPAIIMGKDAACQFHVDTWSAPLWQWRQWRTTDRCSGTGKNEASEQSNQSHSVQSMENGDNGNGLHASNGHRLPLWSSRRSHSAVQATGDTLWSHK